MRWRRPSN